MGRAVGTLRVSPSCSSRDKWATEARDFHISAFSRALTFTQTPRVLPKLLSLPRAHQLSLEKEDDAQFCQVAEYVCAGDRFGYAPS